MKFPSPFLAILALTTSAHAQSQYPFQNPDLPLEQRVTNILSLMTLEEKTALLETSTAVPRLGIPNIGSSEGLHGLARNGGFGDKAIPTTTFPEVIGMASTWDPELIRRAAAAEADEARYISQNSKYRTPVLVVWAPNADLARDPRWGRNNESYGEDPYLAGTMSTAFVQGLQGDNLTYWKTASLLKHFLANSNETTRGGSSSNFDERLFWNYYSVPFRMSFQQGGARSFMASYNAWNHIPMTVNPILRTAAIQQWGVDGIISSDATAVEQLVDNHKYFKDPQTALAAAIKAGINQILTFVPNLSSRVRAAVDAHLLTESDLDQALRGKFRTVIRLGLLDPPSRDPYASIGAEGQPEPWTQPDHKKLALTVAQESVVLLKNQGSLLPLNRNAIRSIAVIGPRANDVLIDIYGGQYPYSVTPLDGIKSKVGSAVTVRYAATNENDAAVKAAKESDVAVVVVGNHPVCGSKMSIALFNADTSTKPCADPGEGREGRDRESINLSKEDLIRQVYAANPKTVVALVSSFPYAIVWTQKNVPAILQMAHASQEEGTALADVLFGDYTPGGRLNQTWPQSLSQLPPMNDYNIRNGRTYMYFKGEPLYPFGYGLSYTSFEYKNLKLSSENMAVDSSVTVSLELKNTGKRRGDEVVQLYVRTANPQAGDPRQELRAFQRATLGPDEVQLIQFKLPGDALGYWNEQQHRFVTKAGPIELLVGSSSADIRLRKNLNLF
jgi:beta-glucosidase